MLGMHNVIADVSHSYFMTAGDWGAVLLWEREESTQSHINYVCFSQQVKRRRDCQRVSELVVKVSCQRHAFSFSGIPTLFDWKGESFEGATPPRTTFCCEGRGSLSFWLTSELFFSLLMNIRFGMKGNRLKVKTNLEANPPTRYITQLLLTSWECGAYTWI